MIHIIGKRGNPAGWHKTVLLYKAQNWVHENEWEVVSRKRLHFHVSQGHTEYEDHLNVKIQRKMDQNDQNM